MNLNLCVPTTQCAAHCRQCSRAGVLTCHEQARICVNDKYSKLLRVGSCSCSSIVAAVCSLACFRWVGSIRRVSCAIQNCVKFGRLLALISFPSKLGLLSCRLTGRHRFGLCDYVPPLKCKAVVSDRLIKLASGVRTCLPALVASIFTRSSACRHY